MRALLVFVLAIGCAKAKTNELPPEAWDVADFTRAGIDTDKPWTAADFTHAATVLKDVTNGHRERLPRFQSAKSGAVFAKLLAALPPDGDRPIGERFGAHAARYEAALATTKLYVENALDVPTREWIELNGVLLREAAVLSIDADEMLASFGPDDPKRQVRLDGLAKMKAGFGTMVLGALLIADNNRVPEADRIALVEHLAARLPALFPFAEAGTQRQIRELLAKQVAGFPAGKLRDALIATQQALPPA